MSNCLRMLALAAVLMFSFLTSDHRLEAQTVWSGLSKSFSKSNGADGTLFQNQDALTPNVYIARSSSAGIYNAATEPNYLDAYSPEFTEWATTLVPGNESASITATNWAALSFTDWIDAYGGSDSPDIAAALTSHSAVVHLTLDNIYLDLKFTNWDQSGGSGFTYLRAEPPGPAGDYNHNDVVDTADYIVWRDTLGSTTDLRANGNNSGASAGKIDQADYLVWKSNYGIHSGSGSASAVPEPSTIALLSIGGFLIVFTRRR